MTNRENKIKSLISTLTKEQAQELLADLIEYAIDSEYIRFSEGTTCLYWDSTGESLISEIKINEDWRR